MRKPAAIVFSVVMMLTAGAGAGLPCTLDTDCPPATPICDLDTCVGCLLDIDCGSSAPHCNAPAAMCEGCSTDAECVRFEGLPACHVSGACTECSASNPAPCAGTKPVCNTATGSCAPCASNSDCAGSVDGEVCLGSGACGDLAICAQSPLEACISEPVQSSFRISNTGVVRRDGFLWQWLGGPVEAAEFGDPTATSTYALCIYRNEDVVFQGVLPPSSVNWKWTGNSFRFRDKANLDGIQRALLKVEEFDGNIHLDKIYLKGKGIFFHPPELNVGDDLLTVQLVVQGPGVSSCWGAWFSAPFLMDTDRLFADKEFQ